MLKFDSPLALTIKSFAELSPISEAEAGQINSLSVKVRPFEPNSYIFREGLKNLEYAFVVSGYFYKHKVTAQGQRQLLSIAIPGDVLNPELRVSSDPDTNVQCMSDAVVAYIPMARVNELLANNSNIDLAFSMFSFAEARRLREWLLNIGVRDGRSRVANFINEFAFRTKLRGLSDGINFDMPLSQELIGDAVGLSAVHVNRVLQQLVASSLIIYKGRRYKILDSPRFQDAGEFTGNYLSNGMSN